MLITASLTTLLFFILTPAFATTKRPVKNSNSVIARATVPSKKRSVKKKIIKHTATTNISHQTGIAGFVKAVKANSMTLKGLDDRIYTIKTTTATVTKSGAPSSVATIKVGEKVLINGTLTGPSAMTATSIID